MRRIFLLPVLLAATVSVSAQAKKPVTHSSTTTKTVATAAKTLKTTSDSLSFALGLSFGTFVKNQGISNINYAMLNKAVEQTVKGEKPLMDMAVAQQLLQRVSEAKMQQTAMLEKQKGQKFLEDNKKRAGVKVTASGLQYEVLKEGSGPKPTKADTVSAHYIGTLYSGKEFDNSYKRGEPLTIPVAGVIPGWTEALQLMPVGSKWRLYIPSDLGYGDYGAGGEIPGGAALVFDVELLDILHKGTTPGAK